eukprot:UN10718
MSTSYPSHWWSFAIAGLIFAFCIFIFYWKIRNGKYKESQYIPVDESQTNEPFSINTPPMQSSNNSFFKKIFRFNEEQDLEEGSVISVGSYHAKQSSLYQSFNIVGNHHFTQLSSYGSTPNRQRNNINNNERVDTMKEMCQESKTKL